ncbi:SMI1/KNR4 family protein [Streptomyces sp. NPDC059819]|uniref:SMI1/KNR4 family protein n=1 Tax=Streptomyces sp. NPDC059819 TaxID=3346963 RepID=UPI00366707EA
MDMDADTVDWPRFLTRWSAEWADARRDEVDPSPEDETSRREGWLGYAPADGADIAALEERLGCELPPSYCEFLRVSNGWRHAGGFVRELAGTEDAHWHEDAHRLGDTFDAAWDDEDNPPEVRAQVGLWARALQLHVDSDATYLLLDPADVGPDGEWAVREWAGWHAAEPRRYPSFAAYMVAMHQEFHHLESGSRGQRNLGFVNETTREQDAAVGRARTLSLRGDYEEAARLLTEAAKYGRPYADELRDQIVRLGGLPGFGRLQPLPCDSAYLSDLLPLAAAVLRDSGRGAEGRLFADPEAFPDTARAAADILREVAAGTWRYTPGGAFGEAVDAAREKARWGDTDTAWRILRAAIPRWESLGPDHIAPLGLLADPVLAMVLTPERRRELLATPRGGEQGPGPAPTGDLDPVGLSWLVRPEGLGSGRRSAFRLVLVEGAAPAELPDLIGSSTVLAPPLRAWDVHHPSGRRQPSQREDKALLSVGRAAPGWSFGIDVEPLPFVGDGLISPAPAASARGGHAIVVWYEPRPGAEVFHLSVARAGDPLYALTVRAGAVEEITGALPAELAPHALGFTTPGEQPQRAAAARALDAVAERHGLTLPRLALTQGRLHSFESVSWSRPPDPGDFHWTAAIG